MISGRMSDCGIFKVMSRHICVVNADGSETAYPLSIAEISVDSYGVVTNVEVRPFDKEIEAVEYYDSDLRIEIGKIFP